MPRSSLLSARTATLLGLPGCVFITQDEYDERVGQGPAGCDSEWFADADGDGLGDADQGVTACDAPSGTVSNADDCDDTDPSVLGRTLLYVDEDGDGFGAGEAETRCPSKGLVAQGGDCDDGTQLRSPAAPEDCATPEDDDCDDDVNDIDAVGCTPWYADGDGDGVGAGPAICACAPAEAWPTDIDGDCADDDPDVSPSESETCGNGKDDNCDGGAPECALSGDWTAGSADRLITGDSTSKLAATTLAHADLGGTGAHELVIGAPETQGNRGRVTVWGYEDDDDLGLAPRVFEGATGGGFAGWSVGGGDLDGDGASDLVVGAHLDGGGTVFLVFGPIAAGGDLADADVALEGSTGNDKLGYSLAMARGWDDDAAELVVGSKDASDLSAAGMVAVFEGPPEDGWSEHDAVARIEGDVEDIFVGYAVTAGDLDDDGLDDVVGGAPGAASVFAFQAPIAGDLASSDADWAILGTAGSLDAGLGGAVAVSPDLTGDGCADLVAASVAADRDGDAAGVVYLWSACAMGTVEPSDLTDRIVSEPGWELGQGLETGDLDSDAVPDLVVGARSAVNGTSAVGAAMVFAGPVEGAVGVGEATYRLFGSTAADKLGWTLGLADFDGDGFPDLAAGAPGLDIPGTFGVGGVALVLGGGP